MPDSISCDVVLLPNTELSAKALSASQSLAQFDSLFTIDNNDFYAHSSLYMLELKTADLDKAVTLLQTIAKQLQPISGVATRYDQKERFIDAEYEVTAELSQLQMQVINTLNDVRNGMRAKDKERMLSATGVALKNFQQYGYKPVGELFRPHITLTRFNDEPTNAQSVLPDVATFSGTFDRLALFEMGDNGTCVRKIAEWNLS